MQGTDPYKLSPSFWKLLAVILIAGMAGITYWFSRTGEDWKGFLVCAVIGLLLVWHAVATGRRIGKGLLSTSERSYVVDLGSWAPTRAVKRLLFPDVDIEKMLELIVVLGGVMKWLLFLIFLLGVVVTGWRHDPDVFLMAVLAFIWFPSLDRLVVRKIDYKLVFVAKLLLTVLVFMVGIASET